MVIKSPINTPLYSQTPFAVGINYDHEEMQSWPLTNYGNVQKKKQAKKSMHGSWEG